MYSKDSQLLTQIYLGRPTTKSVSICETYRRDVLHEVDAEEPAIDPLTWGAGDIVTLRVGGFPLQFRVTKTANPSKNAKYYHNLVPIEDYSAKYGDLPNIGTAPESHGGPTPRTIKYVLNRPINVSQDVIKGDRLVHGQRVEILDYIDKAGASQVAKQQQQQQQQMAGMSQQQQQRWTAKPEHKYTARAGAADWKPFERSDWATGNPITGWVAKQAERGWQQALAPRQAVVRTGPSRYATNQQQQQQAEMRPEPGSKMHTGYEGGGRKTRRGPTMYSTPGNLR
jgi:hypothetical protein